MENGNVIVDENQKKIIQFTKRRFRDSLETIDMLEQALLENFTSSINPIAVQTMAMLVGDESLQFRFVDSSLNPIQYHITYNQETKQLIAPATVLQHMTLGIDTITSSRDKNTYKHWTMSGYTSPVLDQISQKYYFYAKVPTGTGTGEFVLSPTAIGMNDVSGYYHLLVGVLNSEYDGERSFATLYGFTEVLPGRITTDKIVSADGKTYFDLANSIIGGNIRFRSTNGTDKNVSDLEDELNERIDTQAQEFVEAVGGLQSQIDGAIESFFYEYDAPLAGEGRFIHTYQENTDPLPSFEGEPRRVALTAPDARALAQEIWASLNEDNKVSLYVCYRDLSTGKMDSVILNKHQ